MSSLLWAAALVGVLYVLYQKFFQNQNNRGIVYANIWEMQDKQLILLTPQGPVKCFKRKNSENVEKLKLPKKWCKTEIEGVNFSDYIMNKKGLPLVDLIRTGIDEFEIAKPTYEKNVDKIHTSFEILDRDVAFWGDISRRENSQRHNVDNFWQKYAPLIMMGVVFVFGIIIFNMAIDKGTESMIEIAGEIRGTREDQEYYMEKIFNAALNYGKQNQVIVANVTTPPDATGAIS